MTNKFKNPILEGFSPDPSVCSVGDDYYLVTSTFSYFPGVPIYHSKDLVNWQQIGNILERREQIELMGGRLSQGIYAPCLRYHKGLFYMITTNVTNGGNFYVTAIDPTGAWSDPYYLKDAPGIDPSLFFDDNNHCYYLGTRPRITGCKYDGDWEIWIQELDLETHQLIGISTSIWHGAMRHAIWPEGPHLYKKDGYYYLMIAEGGTGSNHCITIARSQEINGPYEGNRKNPILTHRHLGKNFPVQNVGHGDLVNTPDNQWYMTCLASRKFDGYSNLGRETFLAEIIWEDGWPVVNPGIGRLLEKQEHELPLIPFEKNQLYTFNKISSEFLFLRNPDIKNYDIISRPNWLRLHPTKVTLKNPSNPTYIGLRQQSMNYEITTELELKLNDGDEAGLAIFQNEKYAIRLVVIQNKNHKKVQMIVTIDGIDSVTGEQEFNGTNVKLSIIGYEQKVRGILILLNKEIIISDKINSYFLSTEIAGGFVGCTMGLYTTTTSENPGYVDVQWINLKNNEI